jgi:hypothetical protein
VIDNFRELVKKSLNQYVNEKVIDKMQKALYTSSENSNTDKQSVKLRKLSRRHNLKMRDTTIQKLLYAANNSLSRSTEELAPELLILKMKIQDPMIHSKRFSLYWMIPVWLFIYFPHKQT